MEDESREGTVNLAALCLNLYEDMERKQGVAQCRIKPLPKDNAFDKEVVLKEYIYHALYTAICELIGNITMKMSRWWYRHIKRGFWFLG